MTNSFELTTTYEHNPLRTYDTSSDIRILSGKGGWIFDIIKEHSITITNNITDNFLENGTAVQDCVTHSPIIVNISGLKGELVFPQKGWQEYENYKVTNKGITVGEKLGQLGSLLPSVSNKVQAIKQNAAFAIDVTGKYVTTAINALADFLPRQANIEFFSGDIEYTNTRIYQTYQNLKRLQSENLPFVVVTPFDTLENMYIQNVNFSQGNNNYIADVSITFKQVNFSGVAYTETNKDKLDEIVELQRQEEINNGKAQGNDTILGRIIKFIIGDKTGRGGVRRK